MFSTSSVRLTGRRATDGRRRLSTSPCTLCAHCAHCVTFSCTFETLQYSVHAVCSLVPQPTCCWKWLFKVNKSKGDPVYAVCSAHCVTFPCTFETLEYSVHIVCSVTSLCTFGVMRALSAISVCTFWTSLWPLWNTMCQLHMAQSRPAHF